MNVAFVVNDLQLSGGIGVVVEHARQLARRHAMAPVLVLAREQEDAAWLHHRGLADVPVLGLAEARGRRFDVAVATWWETVYALLELRADRHAFFVQSLEERFYRADEPERLAAAITHDLPLALLTEARWIAATLEAVRPGARVRLVRNGVDKDVFAGPAEPPPAHGSPLRILVEGDPATWFKGVPEALAACAQMREARHVTLVAPGGSAPDGAGADRVLAPVGQRELAALYADSHVVLKLSRVEGMYGPPLEGFHMGATTVTTAVTGHEEYVRHGHNGLVVEWDDARGTARALDLLARDRPYLHLLRRNALRTARAWPSWEHQGGVMAAALRAIAAEPAPGALSGAAALIADVRAGTNAQREVWLERGRLRYRVAPLLALDRAAERAPARWVLGPARRTWGWTRRRMARR